LKAIKCIADVAVQGKKRRGRLVIVAIARMRGYFFKNAWHFADIFRAFRVFFEISIVFKDIFRVIEAFLN
jgi:hypothetical protein